MKKIFISTFLTITSFAVLHSEDKKIKNNTKSFLPALFSKSSSKPKKKITPLEYLQKEYSGVLKKNPEIKKYFSMLKHSSIDKHYDVFAELDFIAPTVKTLHDSTAKIITTDKKKAKIAQESFLDALTQLNNVKNPMLRNFTVEIADFETLRLDKKAIQAKLVIDNQFATDVYSLGQNLISPKND